MKKIGIIGGTFNPIHIAHLAIADQFYDQLNLDKCYFVPTYQSPFKSDSANNENVEAKHRLNMVELALGNNPHFSIDSFEIENEGVSYSYKTVEHFNERFSDADLYFLIGQDQANFFQKWLNWESICRNSQLTIAKRINEKQFPTKDVLEISKNLTVDGKEPIWIKNSNIEVSSSDIRSRFRDGKSTNYLLPDSVYDYIKLHKLYK